VEETQLELRPTADLQAYDHFLLGRHYLRRWGRGQVEKANGHLIRAGEIDPNFPAGQAGLAYTHAVLGTWGFRPEEVWPAALKAADRALSMDENQDEAHTALALEALSHRYDWEDAEARFQLALEKNPDSTPALDWYGLFLSGIKGHHDEARDCLDRAIRIEPLAEVLRYHRGVVEGWASDYKKGQAFFDDLIEAESGSYLGRLGYTWLLTAQHRYAEALESLEVGMNSEGRPLDIPLLYGVCGFLNGRVGFEEKARSYLHRLEELSAGGTYVTPLSKAHIHAGLGERESALDFLEEACRTHSHFAIWIGNVPWTFEDLQSEPRFQKLMKWMDFPRLRQNG
jgi:serine/threonine-protein kinase